MTFVSLPQNACSQSLVKTFPIYSMSWGYPCGMTFLSPFAHDACAWRMFAYLSQEFLVAMWDGISVPFIEHHACAEMNFGKKRSKTLSIYPKSFWLPCGMTLLSHFEHHACAELNFGKNDPKLQFIPRVKGSHVGRRFCPWFDTAHAQKQKTRF